MTQLEQLADELAEGQVFEQHARTAGSVPGDEDGELLQQLLHWRQLRQHAITAELTRLNSLLSVQ
jgi:hypothetical protein